MRIALVAEGRIDHDPRARALAWSLRHVGHEVVALDAAGEADWADSTVAVPTRTPTGGGLAGAALRRMQPSSLRTRLHRRRLAEALSATRADIVYPMTSTLAETMGSAIEDGAIARDPAWTSPPRDLVWLAPHEPRLSSSPAGVGLGHHMTLDDSPGYTPEPGRHRGRKVALVHRHTSTTPARYLTSALTRAGAEVVSPGLEFDPGEVDGLDAVVVVESPYPPATLLGESRAPVLMWIHHGEHHLGANLRLVDRLRPDAVMLAHSWHLAHRFPVPVHRFPFGVPVELFPDRLTPWAERAYDVAMVGAGMHEQGGRYDVRHRMVSELEDHLGDHAMFPPRVDPSVLAAIYANTRMVINDGGTRHHPITMRIFETIGAEALALTQDQPGTDVIVPRHHYRVLDEEDVVDQVRALASDPDAEDSAAHAHRHALAHHTYDHRVDELFEIVDATEPSGWEGRPPPESLLGRVIDDDIDVDTIAADSQIGSELPDRVVWDVDHVVERLASGGRVDGAVFTRDHPQLGEVVRATRRFIYATPGVADRVADALARHHPQAEVSTHDGVMRADTGTTEGYRVRDEVSA